MRAAALFVAVLSLGLPAAGPLAAASPGDPPWRTRVEAAVEEARASGRPLLVDLYAEWCVWCKKLEREVFSTAEFQRFAAGFVLLRVDTEDGAEGTRLAERYGVFSLPTTLILTPSLALAGSVRGFAAAPAFIARVEAELARWRDLDAQYRAAAGSTDAAVLRDLADQVHRRQDGERAAPLYERLLTGQAGADEPQARELRYLLADAWRLAGRYREAAAAAASLRAALAPGDPLLEQLDLLAFRMERDQGRCREAALALEAFLAAHPGSYLTDYARQALEGLKNRGEGRCT